MQNHEILELVFVVIAALALTLQTAILFALYLGVSKSFKSLKQEVEEMRSSVMPTIEKTRDIIDRVSPKFEQTVADCSEIARSVRAQAVEIEAVTSEVLDRVRKETGRIDAMFANTLDAVDKAGAFVSDAVNKPMRQLSGILAGIKAVVETLSTTPPPSRGNNVHRDEDMFV
ncbi:MAG: hypothetical protein ABSF17_17315 [Terracidiphilus sp.]|jgi:methyl-accepting chemotaxis protein